jgi:hypothetical protein
MATNGCRRIGSDRENPVFEVDMIGQPIVFQREPGAVPFEDRRRSVGESGS